MSRRNRRRKNAIANHGWLIFGAALLGICLVIIFQSSAGSILEALANDRRDTKQESVLDTEEILPGEEETELSGAYGNAEVPEGDSDVSGSNEAEGNAYDRTEEVTIPDVEFPYYIRVNRQANCVTVYTMDENGMYSVPVKAMVCSVGLNNKTPLGVFRTSDKYDWRYLYGNVYGQYAYRITGAIMFHSVPYYTQNKDDMESEEYNKLGEAASLGCIRLACADAKWLVDHCPKGTTVEIYDSEDPGPLGRPDPVRIDITDVNAGWDPTDPDPGNPWNQEQIQEEPVGSVDFWADQEETEPETTEQEPTEDVEDNIDIEDWQTMKQDQAEDPISNEITEDDDQKEIRKDTAPPKITILEDVKVTVSYNENLMNQIREQLLTYIEIEEEQEYTLYLQYGDLVRAAEGRLYGRYQCLVYAVDSSGNRSEDIVFDVQYVPSYN